MIQATVAQSRPSGLLATLKSLLFSGGPITAARQRRAMTQDERQFLLNLRERAWGLMDTHELYTDEELVGFMVGNMIEPLQHLMRKVAASWGEAHLGRLANLLEDACAGLASFDEKLVDRSDFLEGLYGLDELANDLGVLARS